MVLGTTVAAADSAECSVTFDASWSAATHPSDIPSVPHFSKLVGGGIRLSLGSVSTTFSITNPQDPISLITGFPFTGTGPLGTFTFELIRTMDCFVV
jgi:hypothetical protein